MKNPILLAGVAAGLAWALAVVSVRAQPPTQPSNEAQTLAPKPAPAFRAKFEAANITHDGRLTKAQAEAGNMPMVARNFDAIDAGHKGYVTLGDLRAYRQARRAAAPPQTP